MRQVLTKSRIRALRFAALLGLLMVSYQNCSSDVSFQASDALVAAAQSPNDSGSTGTGGTTPVTPTDGSPTTPTVTPAPTCMAPRISVGQTCVCPAGSNDIGNSCLTCSATEKFNPMTLKCEPLAVACAPGQTYDGHNCVAISPTCDSYVEVTSSKFAIPARAIDPTKGKVCYYVKLVSKIGLKSSDMFPERRDDIVSRLHGGAGNAPPHVMASKQISFVLQGDREVVLAGDSHGGADIYVDNYFLVEIMFPGLMKPNLWASGTADALPYDSKGVPSPIMVGNFPVDDWHAYGAGGTSTFHAINMFNQLAKDKEISFRGSSLDCGSVGETSDVYLLFR